MWQPLERLKSPRTALTVTVFAAGASALTGTAFAQNVTEQVPPHSCLSPAYFDTTKYIAPGTSDLALGGGFFTSGVIVRGQEPAGVEGVQALWKHPDSGQGFIDHHASQMISRAASGQYALKMAVGRGWVIFGVRFVAPEGSKWCEATPVATVEPRNPVEYYLTPGTIPWQSVFNGINNEFAHIVHPSS